MAEKKKEYEELVDLRKKCFLCNEAGFVNQSKTKFDTKHIGNWSTWANNLNAKVLIVGQDYCNQEIFKRDHGKIELKELNDESKPHEYSTATNHYLRELSKIISLDIGLPTMTSTKNIFLTNSVLCLKNGKMNAGIPQKVYENCGKRFLQPLIKIISPKIIIALGSTATKAVISTYKENIPDYKKLLSGSFNEIFLNGKINLEKPLTLFPVYHPGGLGRANRKKVETGKKKSGWELQQEDWWKINDFLNHE